MLYLNYPYLTAEKICAQFKVDLVPKLSSKNNEFVTLLQQFKNKLVSGFFPEIHEKFNQKLKSSERVQLNIEKDEAVLSALKDNSFFNKQYPQLTAVLTHIFNLKDPIDLEKDIQALEETYATATPDWHVEKSANEFQKLDARYGYFKNVSEEQYKILEDVFERLSIACRTMDVLFEHDEAPRDETIFNYSYKLMVLFIDVHHQTKDAVKLFDDIATKTNKLLTQTDVTIKRPLHDILLVHFMLPNANTISDLKGWRALIANEGEKMLRFWVMAESIEKKIAEKTKELPRAPKNKQEANEMAALCNYQRSDEDPAFSALCYAYKVPEAQFNACLNYINQAPGWPKKRIDTIPDIQVEGEGIAKDFYWVKLPVGDKRSLILGKITDCCQSITGDSEKCVKDAVSLSDNGLYVLVKKMKKGNAQPIHHGEIDEKNFKIIGQSYVWRSQTGNLCLDSIECLRESISDAALQSILSDFSAKIFESTSDIQFVTVGRGGKTPSDLFPPAWISEVMNQGFFYGDSKYQYRIGNRPCLMDKISIETKSNSFRDCLDYLGHYVRPEEHFSTKIQALLEKDQSIYNELNQNTLMLLLRLEPNPSLSDLERIDWDAIERLPMELRRQELEGVPTARLIWRDDTSEKLSRSFHYLSSKEKVSVLSGLNEINPTLLTKFIQHDFDRITSVLPDFILSLGLYFKIYNSLHDKHKTAFYDEMKEQLAQWIDSHSKYIEVMKTIPHEKEMDFFNLIKDKLLTMTQDISSFDEFDKFISTLKSEDLALAIYQMVKDNFLINMNTITEFKNYYLTLSDRGKFVFLSETTQQLFNIIQSVEDYVQIASQCNTEHRALLFDRVIGKIPAMIQSVEDYDLIASQCNEKHRALLFNIMIGEIPTMIQSLYDYVQIASQCNTEHRALLFDRVIDKIPALIQSVYDYEQIASWCNQVQSATLFEKVIDKIMEIPLSYYDYKSIEKYLNDKQRVKLFESKSKEEPFKAEQVKAEKAIFDQIKSIDAFKKYMNHCDNDFDRNSLAELMINKLPSMIKCVDDLATAMACIDSKKLQSNLFELIKSDLVKLDLDFMDSLQVFYVLKDEKSAGAFYDIMKDKIIKSELNPTLIGVIVSPLPVRQAVEFCEGIPDQFQSTIKDEDGLRDLTSMCSSEKLLMIEQGLKQRQMEKRIESFHDFKCRKTNMMNDNDSDHFDNSSKPGK